MWKPVLAIALGSTAGGLLRWQLSVRLNGLLPHLPLGTLAANLIAGYLVGLALAWLAQAPGLSPEWRLLLITGFCGGLSTFSTFSAEILDLLQRGAHGWMLAAIVLHVCGAVVMTALGFATVSWLRSV